jgi:hypothetical protein
LRLSDHSSTLLIVITITITFVTITIIPVINTIIINHHHSNMVVRTVITPTITHLPSEHILDHHQQHNTTTATAIIITITNTISHIQSLQAQHSITKPTHKASLSGTPS